MSAGMATTTATKRKGRIGRGLLATAGTVLTILGLAGAAVTGPDNIVAAPAQTLTLSTSGALTTAPDLIAARGGSAVIQVSDPAGKALFVGAGHPVDVQDALRGREVTEITGIRGLSDVTTRTRHATDTQTKGLPDPATLAIWSAKDAGTGDRSVTVPLDGTAASVAVIGTPKASVSLTAGLLIAGLFWACLGIAALGLLLVGLAWWLGRRARRRTVAVEPLEAATGEPAAGTTTCEPEPAGRQVDQRVGEPVTGTADTLHSRPTHDPRAAYGRSGVRRLAAAAAVLALVPATTTACSVPTASATPTLERPTLTAESAKAMWADYDVRNNAAIKAQFSNVEAWAKADRGITLDEDRYSTALRKAKKDTATTTYTHQPVGVYAVPFTSYPVSALASSRGSTSTDASYTTLNVMRREHAGAPWLLSANVQVETAKLPAPTGGALTAAQLKRVAEVATSLETSIKTGKAGPLTPKLDLGLDQTRAICGGRPTCTMTVNVSYADGEDKPVVNGAGSVAAAKVTGGVVALAAFRTQLIANETDPNRYWTYAGDLEVLYGKRATSQLMVAEATPVAVFIPDSGAVQVLGIGESATLVPGLTVSTAANADA